MQVSVKDVQLSSNVSKTLNKLKLLGCGKAGHHKISSGDGLSSNDLIEVLKTGLAAVVDGNGKELRPLTAILKSVEVSRDNKHIDIELLVDIID